jgi:hypothetical protein
VLAEPAFTTSTTDFTETLDYVLKGADDAARERLGIRREEPGGVIVGKRCGVSQNIGPEARRVGFATSTRTHVRETP